MELTRRYEFEGLTLDIPLRFDDIAGIYIEEYPDFILHPIYTPQGHPVMFAGEDACTHAQEATPGGCPDCGSCLHYRPAAAHTWFGVCGHSENRQTERAAL